MAEVNLSEIKDKVLNYDGRKLALVAAIVALLGFIGLAIGLAVSPTRTFLSYVMAYFFAFSVVTGALFFTMIGYATNASWMAVVRRVIECVVLPLPALAVLFIAIPFGIPWLYPWYTPPPGTDPHTLEVLHHRAAYMNVPFFVIRAVVFFAIFLVAGMLLRRWSVRRDRLEHAPVGDPKVLLGRERAFASAMLPPVGLAFTFASMDWVMSLQPAWYSSIFAIYLFGGGFLAAIGLVTALAGRMWSRNLGGGTLSVNHFHALGRLLFAFTVFWAYNAFFQAMLIRIANKPEEVRFYIERITGMWAVFAFLLAIGHFAVPFLLLLLRAPKFRPRVMAIAGAWLLAMNLIDVYWLVIPSRVQGWAVFSWLDLAALAAVVGTCVAVAAWRQHRVAIVAVHDPFLAKGITYRSTL
jgi:hypothetical protein